MQHRRSLPRGSAKYVLYVSNLLLYGFTGMYYCFISLYLNEIHSYTVAGVLLAIPQAVAIFAPLFWGKRTDRAHYKKAVLLVMMIGATVCYCAVPISDRFIFLAIALALTMFFLSAIGSILDVIGMEVANSEGVKYGPMRLMGMLGYGFVAFGLSFFIGDRLDTVFIFSAALGLLCCICIGFMPGVRGYAATVATHENKEKPDTSHGGSLRHKSLFLLIAILATAQFAYGYSINFFPTYLTVELHAPTFLWGTNVLITTLSEMPVYFCLDTLFKRFGIKKILPIVLIGTVARYLLLGTFKGFFGILAIAALTGMFSVALLYTIQFFVIQTAHPALRARTQTLVYAIGVSVPRMLSGVIGAKMTEAIGTAASMSVCAAIALLGFLIAIVFIVFDKRPSTAHKKPTAEAS